MFRCLCSGTGASQAACTQQHRRARLLLQSRGARGAPRGSGDSPGPAAAPRLRRCPHPTPSAARNPPRRGETRGGLERSRPPACQPPQRTETGAGAASAQPGPLPLTLALPASSLRLRASSCASMRRPGRCAPPALSRRRQRSFGHGRPGPLPARRRASHTARGGALRPLATASDARGRQPMATAFVGRAPPTPAKWLLGYPGQAGASPGPAPSAATTNGSVPRYFKRAAGPAQRGRQPMGSGSLEAASGGGTGGGQWRRGWRQLIGGGAGGSQWRQGWRQPMETGLAAANRERGRGASPGLAAPLPPFLLFIKF